MDKNDLCPKWPKKKHPVGGETSNTFYKDSHSKDSLLRGGMTTPNVTGLWFTIFFFKFHPRCVGEMIQFDLRIFFQMGGENRQVEKLAQRVRGDLKR